MDLKLPLPIDAQRVIKYVGAKDDALDLELFSSLESLLVSTAKPKAVYRELSPIPDEIIIGEDVKKHLSGCYKAIIFAVTLGVETDILIRKTAVKDVYHQVLLDAMASVATEQTSELFENGLKSEYLSRNEYLTLSYAPGYGDYSLSVLPFFLSALDSCRKIGVSLGDNGFMLPRKTICAIIGVSHSPVSGFRAGCEHCAMNKSCKLRKEGKTCVR